ncbi:YgfZ/GcvT domain-containing protein [Jeongeupia naejangsanensis]|uniref:Folate-binding protein YgfZ n=1 Tax=Jeongeupia naejangsanensis TaxID=613195 RepID=A0ABS2BM75_9NEIS|nr:folate-binding protein YgfZ [Jeongeupia naejangsanensis]MBM3116715.1 folate-binding protein YgfZ [Jeongeupia naejangsanensis]
MPWNDTLESLGARRNDAGIVTDFGNAAEELAALASQSVVSPLAQYGLIRFSGEETATFLNGQLSSDVRTLALDTAQYSSYSTPKGRMLASFLVFRAGEDYLLQIASELQPAIQKRLGMFILRTKTKPSDASAELLLLGVAGPDAAAKITAVTGQPAPAPMAVIEAVVHGAHTTVIGLADGRFELAIPADAVEAVWQALVDAGARPVGEPVWRLTEIRAGAPWITAPTQEAFVAQMANMELIGAVSFTKGCYPGQEIVARTQYLGKLKRRMFRMHVAAEAQTGDDVFSAEMNGQASGKILLAAPAPEGGFEALVVAQIASLEHSLHLGSVDGPPLSRLDLPYAVD